MPSKLTKVRTKLFLKKYGLDIAKAIQGTGLYFEAVVGQKCNESAYGTSNLAINANNFGGIRNFGSLAGAIGTTASGYAKFRTPQDCFKTYVQQLQSPTKKYTKNGVFTASSPEEQLTRMVNSGYAKGPASEYVRISKGAIDSTRELVPKACGRVSDLSAISSQLENLQV